MDEGCSEAVQEVFIQLYKKGYIYRGSRIINWCPICQTSISDAEVEHVDQDGFFWHILYPIVKEEGKFVEIATTRPETLLDGSYHPVDSSELAFKMAASIAFKDGFLRANPMLLEPVAELSVVVPDKFTGDVMGDLNRRRARVLGMESVANKKQNIRADIPMSELFGYSTSLRSITGGLGEFSYEFARYEQAPGDVQKREIQARASKLEKEE